MIVIPMAGLSNRFIREGYRCPKFMLPINNYTVFDYSVSSFKNFFDDTFFLFIALDSPEVENFLKERLTLLGIRDYQIVMLQEPTRGQAETVAIGCKKINVNHNSSMTIFNIDTFRINNFIPFEITYPKADGVLEVFNGGGDNWSFVEPDHGSTNTNQVKRTAEKTPISNLCCTGIYYFSSLELYMNAFDMEKKKPQAAELYIAPMYNNLISQSKKILYSLINKDEVVFCGVPKEYEFLKNNPAILPDLCLSKNRNI